MGWGHDNDGSDTWALPGRRPKLTSQSLGRLKKPEVDVFPSSSITHCEPDNFSASTRLGFQSTSLSSGYKHALHREEGKGGSCGGPQVTWPGGAHSRVLLSGLMEGVFRDTLFQNLGDTRGSLEREEGTYRPTKSHGPGLSFDFLLPV